LIFRSTATLYGCSSVWKLSDTPGMNGLDQIFVSAGESPHGFVSAGQSWPSKNRSSGGGHTGAPKKIWEAESDPNGDLITLADLRFIPGFFSRKHNNGTPSTIDHSRGRRVQNVISNGGKGRKEIACLAICPCVEITGDLHNVEKLTMPAKCPKGGAIRFKENGAIGASLRRLLHISNVTWAWGGKTGSARFSTSLINVLDGRLQSGRSCIRKMGRERNASDTRHQIFWGRVTS